MAGFVQFCGQFMLRQGVAHEVFWGTEKVQTWEEYGSDDSLEEQKS